MKRRNIFIGDNSLKVNEFPVGGEFVDLGSERFYKISNYDRMPHFFMSIVSASDQWLFISSNGSLTAGRKNSEGALFPYYSEDKIHDYEDITGSKTIILVKQGAALKLWEPFAGHMQSVYTVKRNIYKNLYGNKLIFEEINEDLSLTFQYAWYNCNRFGFVKNAKLMNNGAGPIQVDLLDGLQNILPSEVNSGLQLSSSNLLDAYKRQELIPDVRLAIYRLSSVPTDTTEPSEALKVNTVWSEGLDESALLLSSLQVDHFKSGFPVKTEFDIKATRGAYFLNALFEIQPGSVKEWNIVAEVNQDTANLSDLMEFLRKEKKIRSLLKHHIDQSTEELKRIVASTDAMQCTQDELSTSRHLTNVLFNVMRGGLFMNNYSIPKPDFLSFVVQANNVIAGKAEQMLESSGDIIQYNELLHKAGSLNDPGLIRLCYEYLALTFSRRHGDPSRPWNKFSIENRKEDGSSNLDYQGNWRDIFQNWEALSLSFPEYVESMIGKFVNATTADGYNPYRITRNGIDWEVPDPSDPWSNIGYWGDHQIIYLLKFLEISVRHHPDLLPQLLSEEYFSYANVPYRIKPYEEILIDPHDTISFDAALEEEIQRRVSSTGSDGKLVWGSDGHVLHVNLAEKLMVIILSKLSNLIPGAGIWMNTQRPEWNDANNALVGYGVSMVTTYYLRAFLEFCTELFGGCKQESIQMSEEVIQLLDLISGIINEKMLEKEAMLSDRGMKICMDALGQAGSEYRQRIYKFGFSGKRAPVYVKHLLEFITRARQSVDMTISSNMRKDNLFHSYNLIREEGRDRIALRRLYEMLEGQVAVLNSGFLSVEESVVLLDALKTSSLFREDQYSYILYPDRPLPLFMEKNNISSGMVKRSLLLKTLIDRSNRQIVVKDVNGAYHFNSNFRNAGILKDALHKLPAEYSDLVDRESQLILDIYEEVFDHQSFTGRSGTFYGYEGLGSIYWHMVSKLLLAVCDTFYRAHSETDNEEILGKLADHYYEIRAGIGLNKDPHAYGAFPTDPYSHTPGNRGAQQPGMTGQVKEDIIARWGELGILVRKGCIRYDPILLRRKEFLSDPGEFIYYDVTGIKKVIPLEKDTLAYTYCQVPVKYNLSKERKILLYFKDGTEKWIEGDTIHEDNASFIFRREGTILRIDVWLEPGM